MIFVPLVLIAVQSQPTRSRVLPCSTSNFETMTQQSIELDGFSSLQRQGCLKCRYEAKSRRCNTHSQRTVAILDKVKKTDITQRFMILAESWTKPVPVSWGILRVCYRHLTMAWAA